MEIKSCTNAFCQNKGFYLKDVVIYDEEQVKFPDCVVPGHSSRQEHSDFVACMIPVRKSEIRIMPKIYQKQLNLWIRGQHITYIDDEIPWEVTLQIASRPIIRPKKKKETAIVFEYNTAKSHDLHDLDPQNR